MTNKVIYVLIGERDVKFLLKSIELIQSLDSSLIIEVWHDIEESRLEKFIENYSIKLNCSLKKFNRIKFNTREENRNSSYFRIKALLDSEADNTLYIDNDIFPVHKGFLEGFKICHHYGLSMVQNPRDFIKTYEGNIGDLDIGADVLDYDKQSCSKMPYYMASYNMGVMFHSKNDEKGTRFLESLLDEQQTNPSRGQAGLYRTMWKEKYSPYCLPVNWLVCRRHEGIANPLSLHVGHKNILSWWLKEFNNVVL